MFVDLSNQQVCANLCKYSGFSKCLLMAVYPLYQFIGSEIKKGRKDRGFTQKELSGQIGISRASLANIETGRQRLLVHQLYRIAEHLGLEVMGLLPNPSDMLEIDALNGVDFSGDASPEQQRQLARLIQDAENEKLS